VNIGILSATDPALRKLQADGLSDAKAKAVASDAPKKAEPAPSAKIRPIGNIAPSIKFASLRAALEARIDSDISSGHLAASDAPAVRKTLDDIDNPPDHSFGNTTRQLPAKSGAYQMPENPRQIATAYLATIERGALIDRLG